jgi:hypothetical protein
MMFDKAAFLAYTVRMKRHSRRRQGKKRQQRWHRFLAKGFELSVGRRGVLVIAEVEVTQNPPKVDVLLLRREGDAWTAEQIALLPDGIRDCNASHVLIEFKYTESLTIDAIRQAISYEYFYRTANELPPDAVKMFILCAKTPTAERLASFGYTLSALPGVYTNAEELLNHIPLLVLNGLSDDAHNAFVKAFASRPAQKAKALATIRQQTDLSDELLGYFEVLRTLWSLPEGAAMNEVLTPERVVEIGREWKRILFQHATADELNEMLSPESKQKLNERGVQQAFNEGINQKTRDIVLAMHVKGFDLAVIADIMALPIDQVQALLEAEETKPTL